MSFGRSNNYPDYGATDSRFSIQDSSRNLRAQPRSNFDLQSYHQLCDSISCNIFSINNNVSALEKASKEVGTQADSHLLRDKIHVTRQGTKNLVAETTMLLKILTAVVVKGGSEHKLQAKRVRNEFQATVQRYDTIQKVIDPKLKQAVIKPQNVWSLDEDEEQQSIVDADRAQQYQMQEELEFEQGLLLEREERIRQIETDMLDVNKVFLDLAAMVREQGETIGTIEDHITNTAHNVEEGAENLSKARDYMKSYRNKLCCLVFILVIITVIIAIIVSVSLNS